MTRHIVQFPTFMAVLSQPLIWVCQTAAQRIAGFDVSNATIRTTEIRSGGPPKDGIPALTLLKMLPASRVGYLQPNDRVTGAGHNDRNI